MALGEAVKLVKSQRQCQVRRDDRSRDESGRRSAPCRPDGARRLQPAQRLRPQGRVGVFAKGAKAEEAKKAGADVVGAEDLVETVSKGTIDFDRCIATPDMMGLVGRLGKVLGPRGLMPNPKVGTVTMDVTGAGQGGQGRRCRVPRREGRHRPGRRRQGELLGRPDRRQCQGLRRCRDQGQAAGREGHLRQESVHFFDYGPRPQARPCQRHRHGLSKFPAEKSNRFRRLAGSIFRRSGNLSEIAGAGEISA